MSDLFDALADFISDAFNWLRDRVRDIIDGAKRLARAAINLARDAINGLIDLAADALELAADVFLAAFPEARDKAKKWINKARNTAKDAVNSAASWLVDRVDQLLDALGAALDFILSVYQKFYVGLIKFFKFIVVGFIEIMRNIGRLVDAARAMPDYFEGAVETELIGQDLTQPLFFERTVAAGGQAPAATEPAVEAPAAVDTGTPALGEQNLSLLGQDRLTDDQVAVDSVADFNPDPAFFENLDLQDGAEVEFGGTDSPEASTKAHLSDALGAAPDGAALESAGMEDQSLPESGAAIETGDDTEQRLQQLMDAEPQGACDAKSAPTGGESFPEEQKIGPLTRGQRARFLLSQMWKGIRQWFSCNWPWVLAAAIGALLGIILLEIVTGGAITAALPVLLEILAAVMIGQAVLKASSHVLDYLTKAWGGDILGGAQALARGLAIGAVELIFAVLTYITAGAFRVLAAGAKAATRAVKATFKGAARLGRATAGLARTGLRRVGQIGRRVLRSGGRLGRVGRAVLVRGRLIFSGLRRGFARGVRSIEELAERLGKRLRFKRFKIVRRGAWFSLYGYLNPWVLLANGKLVERKVGGRPMLGDVVNLGKKGGKGIVVGVRGTPSQGIEALKAMSKSERRAFFQQAKQATAGERAFILDEIAGTSMTAQHARELRKSMEAAGKKFRPGQHAHHLVASTHPRAAPARKILEDVGLDFNEAINSVAIGGKRHARLHTHKAIDAINAELQDAVTQAVKASAGLAEAEQKQIMREAVKNALDSIAARVKAGKFP